MGLLNRASFLYIVASEYERRFGSIKKAFELNAVGLNWLKKGEKSRTYFYGLFMKLRMEFTKQPSKALFAKGIRLYSAAVKERLEIQHRIAMQLVFMAEKLHLHREWGHWLGKVHEYELHRVSEERKQEIAQLQVALKLEKLEYDRELDKIKTRQLEAELKSKAHEIELLAAQLAKKGSFLASLKDQIESMKSSDEGGMISADSVTGVIETMRYKDKEYEQLEERAQHLYKDFFVSLSKKFPDLTPAERKVCILMKLGLASKDIANVLFASVRTIENHSLSIRKKMKIPNRIRLSKFMVSL